MVDISTEGEVGEIELPALTLSVLTARAEQLLALLDLADAELSLLICDDQLIQELNAQWRDKDTPTDVLSFPQQEAAAPGRLADPSPEIVLGDIVISVQTAARQAAELGHSLEVELAALLVHGTLHLLGYDHEEPTDPTPMRMEEVRLLVALGLDGAAALVARAS